MALVEVVAYNLESALNAQAGGAARVELCACPAEGGITPGPGLIRRVREKLEIPLHVMIRPRGGDFLYDGDEFASMLEDIAYCRSCEVDGVVLGLLMPDGSLDMERTARLIGSARPMSVTLHRAFDKTADPLHSLGQAMDLGFDRILTSGQAGSAEEGIALIRQLCERSGDQLLVMPGGGIHAGNMTPILQLTGAREVHVSARIRRTSRMSFRKDIPILTGSGSLDDYAWEEVSVERVREMVGKAAIIS